MEGRFFKGWGDGDGVGIGQVGGLEGGGERRRRYRETRKRKQCQNKRMALNAQTHRDLCNRRGTGSRTTAAPPGFAPAGSATRLLFLCFLG